MTTPPPDPTPTEPGPRTDAAVIGLMSSHPTALGHHLDVYLASVARELELRGVITGSPQRTDPAQRLIGSIVLDCTALRVAARRPDDERPLGPRSLGGAVHPERPAPVIVTWDEDMGWCAGLHHDPGRSSRRYLHPDLLPTPDTVADFVVGLALGRTLGHAHPISAGMSSRPRLRLIR